MGLAGSFLLQNGKYIFSGLCQVVSNWNRLGGLCGDVLIPLDAEQDITNSSTCCCCASSLSTAAEGLARSFLLHGQ